MKPNPSFQRQSSEFWALVKYASESLGYSNRSSIPTDGKLKRYNRAEIEALADQFMLSDKVDVVVTYLNYRAKLIEDDIRPLFMDREKAARLFESLRHSYNPTCHLPMNKQKGEKRHYSYFTCIINMLTEKNLGGETFDDSPKSLSLVTNATNRLVKTFSRRVDGFILTL
jgi:hypothetical protein